MAQISVYKNVSIWLKFLSTFLLNAFKTEGHANVFRYVLLIIHPLIEMGKT